MNTLENKENVIRECQKQMEAYKLLQQTMEYCKKFIEDFDNKILNKRLLTAITKDFTDKDICFALGELYQGSGQMLVTIFLCGDYRCYKVNTVNMNYTHYIDYDKADFKVITNQENRIKAEETINVINERINYLSKQIDKYNDAIINYDKYVEMNNELLQYIKKYKENVNQLHQIKNLPYVC